MKTLPRPEVPKLDIKGSHFVGASAFGFAIICASNLPEIWRDIGANTFLVVVLGYLLWMAYRARTDVDLYRVISNVAVVVFASVFSIYKVDVNVTKIAFAHSVKFTYCAIVIAILLVSISLLSQWLHRKWRGTAC